MRKMKKVLAFLLCSVIAVSFLAGCNKGAGGNVTYGRYVEEDISPPEMKGYINNFISFGDGTLDVVSVVWPEEDQKGATADYYRWRSTDGGKNWQKMDMTWAKEYSFDYSDYYDKGETPPEEISLGNIVPLDNGEIIFQVNKYTYDAEKELSTNVNEVWRLGTDGTKTPFTIEELEALKGEGKNVNVNELKALPDGKLYVNLYIEPTEEDYNDPNFDWDKTNRRAVYDSVSGKKLYDVNFNGYDMFFNSDTLFLNDFDKGLMAVKLADGSPSTVELPSPQIMQQWANSYMGSTFVDNENNFFNIQARGMSKLTAQSTEPEQVMEGLNYTYGSPLYYINSAVYDGKDKSIVTALFETQSPEGTTPNGKILRYVWDDKAVATSDNKIKVYSLYENYSVRLALSEFKRQNPDVTIEYETAFGEKSDGHDQGMPMQAEGASPDSGNSNAMTEEDALRALNTELLNGTGPDILILDGLPVNSFVEKGVLEDLSGLVKGNSDLITQVFEPLYQDGKIYTVPTNYAVPILFGEQGYAEQFTNLDTYIEAIKNGAGVPAYQEYNPEWTEEEANAYYQTLYGPKAPEDQPVINFQSVEEVFNTFYSTSAPAIFSEKGGIDQQALAKFLQDIKTVTDKYELASDDMMGMNSGSSMSMMSMGYASFDMSNSLSQFTNRQGRTGISSLGSFQMLRVISYSMHWSANSGGKGVMVDDTADTTEEETKLPEIKTALLVAPGIADGTYQPTQMMGITTTSKQKELAQKFVEVALSDSVQKYDMGNGFPVSKSAFDTLYNAYMKESAYEKKEGIYKIPFDSEALLGSVKTPFYSNDFLRSVIYKPVQAFCAGNMSVDDTVTQIVKETELYFAERK